MQRALIQYRDPKNYALVRDALILAHREDLIGSGPKCLIHAPREGKSGNGASTREGRAGGSSPRGNNRPDSRDNREKGKPSAQKKPAPQKQASEMTAAQVSKLLPQYKNGKRVERGGAKNAHSGKKK